MSSARTWFIVFTLTPPFASPHPHPLKASRSLIIRRIRSSAHARFLTSASAPTAPLTHRRSCPIDLLRSLARDLTRPLGSSPSLPLLSVHSGDFARSIITPSARGHTYALPRSLPLSFHRSLLTSRIRFSAVARSRPSSFAIGDPLDRLPSHPIAWHRPHRPVHIRLRCFARYSGTATPAALIVDSSSAIRSSFSAHFAQRLGSFVAPSILSIINRA